MSRIHFIFFLLQESQLEKLILDEHVSIIVTPRPLMDPIALHEALKEQCAPLPSYTPTRYERMRDQPPAYSEQRWRQYAHPPRTYRRRQ